MAPVLEGWVGYIIIFRIFERGLILILFAVAACCLLYFLRKDFTETKISKTGEVYIRAATPFAILVSLAAFQYVTVSEPLKIDLDSNSIHMGVPPNSGTPLVPPPVGASAVGLQYFSAETSNRAKGIARELLLKLGEESGRTTFTPPQIEKVLELSLLAVTTENKRNEKMNLSDMSFSEAEKYISSLN